MIYRSWLSIMPLVAVAGCASGSLNHALGTPKNPSAIFSDPKSRDPSDQSRFAVASYGVLLEALEVRPDTAVKPADRSGSARATTTIPNVTLKKESTPADIRRYLAAGYNLSDMYCSRYFAKTDEAYRRRRFGRTLTNDVGTAITTIMGLANAGETAVTALAAVTGFADSVWRNYDDSFVISPELATVRTLVLAAQDNFRATTLGKDSELPADYGTAQSTIQRYAEKCSFLGMKALLEQSAVKETSKLTEDTKSILAAGSANPPAAVPAKAAPDPAKAKPEPAKAKPDNIISPVAPIAPASEPPATATPALTSNAPRE